MEKIEESSPPTRKSTQAIWNHIYIYIYIYSNKCVAPKNKQRKRGSKTMTLLSFWALPLKISKLFWVIFTRENDERFERLE